MIRFMSKLEKMKLQEWTKHTYRVVAKKYYQWLYGFKEQDYPPIVSWIHTRVKNNNHILPNELLDGEDLKSLLTAAEKDAVCFMLDG